MDEVREMFKAVERLLSSRPGELAGYKEFTSEALSLVARIDSHLCTLHEQDKETAATLAVMAASGVTLDPVPPAPTALLSTSEVKQLHSLLEYVGSYGIYPYLHPGVHALLSLRLPRITSISKDCNLPDDVANARLYETCSIIARCFVNEVIGASILKHHLANVLIALIQVGYQPDRVNSVTTSPLEPKTRQQCMELLETLLKETYQPHIIKELLVFQGMPSAGGVKNERGVAGGGVKNERGVAGGGVKNERGVAGGGIKNDNGVAGGVKNERSAAGGKVKEGRGGMKVASKSPVVGGSPKWLRQACREMLLARIMCEDGVHHMITSIMEGGAVGVTEEVFDWHKCKAVAKILGACPTGTSSMKDYYSSVCPQLLNLVHVKPTSQSHFRVAVETINFMMSQNQSLSDLYLLQPLTRQLSHMLSGESVVPAAKFNEINTCIYDLRKVSMSVQLSAPVLTAMLPFSPVLFHLWRADITHAKLSAYAKELLEKVLRAASDSETLGFFCFICGIPQKTPPPIHFKGLPPWLHIASGDPLPSLKVMRTSDEEAIGVMGRTSQCIIALLKSGLNSEGLIGGFSIECLKRLHATLVNDRVAEPSFSSSSSSSVLLACEDVLPLTSSEVASGASLLHITAALCEHTSAELLSQCHLPSLLSACGDIVEYHAHVLERENVQGVIRLTLKERATYEEMVMGGAISLNIVLGLLSAVMAGARKVERCDRPLLSSIVQPLHVISTQFPDEDIRHQSGDLRVCIAMLGAVWSHQSARHDPSPLQAALTDLQDPLVPVRGHNLIILTKLITSRDPEAVDNSSTLLRVFKESLPHSDSYVYLPAINGLVALALSAPPAAGIAVTTLCQEYAGLTRRPGQRCDPSGISGAHDGPTEQLETGARLFGEASVRRGSLDVETRMKLGEALVKVSQEMQDMLPYYLGDIVAALLTVVKDPEPLMRASSLSNLAEICGAGRMVLASVITEVLSCVEHVLWSEKEVKVRQASLLVLKHIIKGSKLSNMQEMGEVLRDVYRLLKQVEQCEQDPVARAHAQAALGELGTVARAFLHQDNKMEKKITILGSP